MASLIRHLTVDCADPHTLATFWAAVLDGSLAEGDFPGDPEASVRTPDTGLLFVRVDEPKTTKNRWHVDLQPQDRTRDEEVGRLLGLGATLHEDHRLADGRGWVTLRDPEGNELCVERSQAER